MLRRMIKKYAAKVIGTLTINIYNFIKNGLF